MPFAWETVPSLQTVRPSRSHRNYLNIHFVVFKVFHSSFCPGADELWHYEYGEYSQHPQVSTCGGNTGTALWSPLLSLRNVGFFSVLLFLLHYLSFRVTCTSFVLSVTEAAVISICGFCIGTLHLSMKFLDPEVGFCGFSILCPSFCFFNLMKSYSP